MDLFLNGLGIMMDSTFQKCHKRRSFLLKHSISSLIRALFILVGVGINFEPLDNKEISALDKTIVEKLLTFGLTNLRFHQFTNLPIYNLSNTVFSSIVLFTTIAYAF